MCFAIFVSGYTFRIPIFTKQNKVSEKYLNKHISTTALSKYVTASKDSTYLVFCFSYTCPHCLNSIENLKQYKKSNTVDRIIAIAAGKEKDRLFFEQNFETDFAIQHMSSDSIKTLVDAVPTAFFVQHDTITVIIPSALPSHVLFKKYYLNKDRDNNK
jgi:hypothetical protein